MKARVCKYSKSKYKENPIFKARVCEYSKSKYQKNPAFRANVCENLKRKYKNDENIYISKIQQRSTFCAKQKDRQKDIDFTIKQFNQEISYGPE